MQARTGARLLDRQECTCKLGWECSCKLGCESACKLGRECACKQGLECHCPCPCSCPLVIVLDKWVEISLKNNAGAEIRYVNESSIKSNRGTFEGHKGNFSK